MSIFSISDAKLSVNMRNFNGLLWLKITADFIITDNSSKRSNPPQATAVIIISWVKLDEDFEMVVVPGLETFFNLDSTLCNASDGSMNKNKNKLCQHNSESAHLPEIETCENLSTIRTNHIFRDIFGLSLSKNGMGNGLANNIHF